MTLRRLITTVAALALAASVLLSGCAVRNLFAKPDDTLEPAPAGITQKVENNRMFGVLPHIGAPMPASLTLDMRTRRSANHLFSHAGHFAQTCARGNHHKPKIIT